jgi:hypothetical protein
MLVRSAMFTPTVAVRWQGQVIYEVLGVVSSGRLEAVTDKVEALYSLCEVNSFVENVFPGSSLRSACKLQEETRKGHFYVVIFNISLIKFFKRFHYFLNLSWPLQIMYCSCIMCKQVFGVVYRSPTQQFLKYCAKYKRTWVVNSQ